jgi:hypothetical protein
MDMNNVRITTDSPYTIIKKVGDNTYWNGITWSSSEFQIYLEPVINGVYQYIFTPDTADLYEIVTKSDEYLVSKTETVEVYSEDFAVYPWMVNTEFMIKYPLTDITVIPKVKICKEKSQTYWDGSSWSTQQTFLSMNLIDGSIATFPFIPNEEDKYYVTISDGANELLMMVQASTLADNIPPVIVTNSSMKSVDGSDCTIMTEMNSPLPSVKISVYDDVTKNLVAQTASDVTGAWSLILKPGKYYFLFEKEGYISIGFQRVVS